MRRFGRMSLVSGDNINMHFSLSPRLEKLWKSTPSYSVGTKSLYIGVKATGAWN